MLTSQTLIHQDWGMNFDVSRAIDYLYHCFDWNYNFKGRTFCIQLCNERQNKPHNCGGKVSSVLPSAGHKWALWNGLRNDCFIMELLHSVTIQHRNGSNSHETNQMSSLEVRVQLFGRSCFYLACFHMLYYIFKKPNVIPQFMENFCLIVKCEIQISVIQHVSTLGLLTNI